MCSSPRLIAAYHALHRLLMPRHPPCALLRLISNSNYYNYSIYSIGIDSNLPRPTVAHGPVIQLPQLSKNEIQLLSNGSGKRIECGRHQRTFDDLANQTSTRCSRKEVIQPQVPLRLPCYDFAPVIALALGGLVPCGFRHRLRALTTSMA